MLRMKIIMMAEEKGYTMSQYFIITIYNTVSDWPEDSIEQVDQKLVKLKEIIKIIKSHQKINELMEVIDLSTFRRLQRDIHKKRLLQIMKMSEEER
jgi:precorrin-3B methylase